MMKSQRHSDFPKVHIITISLRKAGLRYMFRFTNGEGVKFVALDYTNVFNTNINAKLVIIQDVWHMERHNFFFWDLAGH